MINHLPNGPSSNTPRIIVVHAMGEYINIGPGYHAVDYLRFKGWSAHSFITPSAVNIRSRKDTEGAWHAKGFNKDSLGLEYLIPGMHDYSTFKKSIKRKWVNEDQYQEGLAQILEWISIFPTITDVVRHSDIDPSRKVDPGSGFPWDRLKGDL